MLLCFWPHEHLSEGKRAAVISGPADESQAAQMGESKTVSGEIYVRWVKLS